VIADTSIIPTAALLVDFDDAFVAYLNNVEIARYNVGVYGDHPTYNTFAYDEHEAQAYQNGNFSAAFFIDPHVVDSALKPGVNVLSIQVHNFSSGLDDMSMIPYFLIGVNDTSVTYFPFPANIHLHTNFTLNSAGQKLTLKDASGNLLDQEQIGGMMMNNSRGRRPDGSVNWCLFDTPTPDTTNSISACYSGYAGTPAFSLPAGFYSGTQTVGISGPPGEIIHYTTDGSVPVFTSPVYSAPIPVTQNRVIRARSFPTNANYLPGQDVVNTYFINENVSVPVISLSTDSLNLFDANYGIYMLGPNADSINPPFFGANFWMGWARPSHVEYFDQGGTQRFESHAEIKIQGNYSKAWPQRGFSVKPKDDYGGITEINYKLFPDKPQLTKFRSFNIRNAGSDWNTCHMRDRLNQKTAQKLTHLDIMDGRPCVLFINGRYWGLYEVREKQDKHYIAENNHVAADDLDFLEFDGSVIEGSNKGFFDMVNFIGNNNMGLAANYDSVGRMLDLENFADYFISETYFINIDWLGSYTNNIKYWRTNKPVGKWRYMLWDTDLSLGFIPWYDGADTTNMLNRTINPSTSNPHSIMLKSLLNNITFRNYFVDRYCDLMNTIFYPSNYRKKADALHDEMLPEMGRQFAMWGGTSPMQGFIGRSIDVPSWEANIDTMEMFMTTRWPFAHTHIQDQFNLVKPVSIGLNVDPPGAGQIRISTIVPDSLPWSGIYFDGVPVTMTVLPNAGYKFLYWKCNATFPGANDSVSITRDLDTNDVFTAYFRSLELNFSVNPNPFGSSVTFTYELPEDAQASLLIYDMLGQRVGELLSGTRFTDAGQHTLTVDPETLGMRAGVYFAVFRSGDFSKTLKLIRARE
jgi:hypothetical protein